MQRPVMNPNFFEDTPSAKPPRRPIWRVALDLALRALKRVGQVLMYDPFSRIVGFHVEDGTPMSRIIRGVLYRLAFVPLLIVATACAIVWIGTHPRTIVSQEDPGLHDVYYEAVTFLGADQTRLEGWMVPVLDAKAVLEEKEKVLRKKHPAVVLVHDLGQRREQMLPLIKPLHDAGFVVLAINLRGGGAQPASGETFGLREAGDVHAAVETLRKRTFVDPQRVAVVGYGTGATAGLLAAQADPQIAAVYASKPTKDAQELMLTRVMPQNHALRWMAPLCKWTFELAYGVDLEETEISRFQRLIEGHRVVVADGSTGHAEPSDAKTAEQVTSFLKTAMPNKPTVAGAN
jgi:pimeloyl-ACP methyl ester carboxylesterase